MNTYIARGCDAGLVTKVGTKDVWITYTLFEDELVDIGDTEVANWEFYYGYSNTKKLVHKMQCNYIEALQWLYEHQDEYFKVKFNSFPSSS